MPVLVGPRLYYSLFGIRGLLMGTKARLLRVPIEVEVAVPGILHPVRLRLRTTDIPLCREILLDAAYDWEIPVSPRVIVDAGANIGLVSVFYANKYPEAKIIAVEPEPSNFEILLKNSARYPNVHPVHAALWNANEELSLFDTGNGQTAFQIRHGAQAAATGTRMRIPGITITKLMEDFGVDYVDLLKLDIEGSEKEVFEQATPWINRVGIIAIELHDWLRSGCRQSVQAGAKDFEVAGEKGWITYLTRQGNNRCIASRPKTEANLPVATIHNISPKFPLKILSNL
jgi:FkbM family methyltransferase